MTLTIRNGRSTDQKVWESYCRELAAWAWKRLAIKRDRHGLYSPDGSASWTFSELTTDDLAAHFAGEITLGCGSTSLDDQCLWVGWDLDNHISDESTNVNLDYAIILRNRLVEMGFSPILEDSDGKGSVHIWVLFRRQISAKLAHWFSHDVASDFGEYVPKIECFPKSPTVQISPQRCGHYLRLPGKHHKRDHWSRFWGGHEWLTAEESVSLLLSLKGDDTALIPAMTPDPAAANREAVPYQPSDTSDADLLSALTAIPADDYETWIQVGMALRSHDDGMLVEWDLWSQTSDKYRNGECEHKWRTFDKGGKVTAKTIFHLAAARGWQNPGRRNGDNILCGVDDFTKTVTMQPNNSSHRNEQKTLRCFAGKSAADLWALADQPVQWLVENVFSCDQPTVFGAKQKSLKTTLLSDLAVSLASGFPWLGRFDIPQKRRVLFITGESSEAAAIRKVRRAAESRNLRREDFTDSLRIEAMNFPELPRVSDCDAVRAAVERHGIEVVLLDPLYMGLPGITTSNLMEVGPALRFFMESCRPANLIVAHHVKKTASFDDAPNLEDLSQAGIAEFAGNYWLMGRLSEYTGDGLHTLAVRAGGRDEQFHLLKLEFDERAWTARFTSLMDHREDVKARRETERFNEQTAAIRGHLKRNGGQATLAQLADSAKTKPKRESFQLLIDELCDSGQYERCKLTGGNNKECDGLKVKGQISKDTVL